MVSIFLYMIMRISLYIISLPTRSLTMCDEAKLNLISILVSELR